MLDFQLPLNIFVMRLIMNLYVLVTLSCSVLLKAQIGSTSVDNFPVYQDTGNPQEDAQRYNANCCPSKNDK